MIARVDAWIVAGHRRLGQGRQGPSYTTRGPAIRTRHVGTPRRQAVDCLFVPEPYLVPAFTPGGSDAIFGITFTFWFVDDRGTPNPIDDVDTDINGDGKLDTGLAEIYYNPTFIWTNRGAPSAVDFFSIITHETGHSVGLEHFGKLFRTKKDQADGFQVSDIKFAPHALMNAAYVTGRNEIEGTDNSSFCQIWASK